MISMAPEDRDALAIEYAAGLLEQHGQRIETMMEDDPVLTSRVFHWRSHFVELDYTAAPIPAPARLWARIQNGVELAAQETPARQAPAASAASRLWESLPVWRWSALAAGAAALILAVGLTVQTMRIPAPAVMVAVLQQDDGRPGAIVEAFADGTVRLIPVQQIDVPQGRALQVWTKRNDEEGPISVGLIDQARTLKLDLGKLPAPVDGQLFEITLEPENGSPTGRPTGPILMKGLTADTL
jgi:anti-sigma-K factor RskA